MTRLFRIHLSPATAVKVQQHALDHDCDEQESIRELVAIGLASDPVDAATMASRTRGFHEVRNLVLSRSSQFYRDLAAELDSMAITEAWKAPTQVQEAHP